MQSGAPVPRSLMDGVTRFLGWWRDELRGLLPERGLGAFARNDRTVVLVQVDGGFQILGGNGKRPGEEDRPVKVLSYAEALSTLAQMAEARTATEAGIRLPLSQCFVRRVELPVAARGDIRQILEFDLERATPFKLKDVYAEHVAEADAGAKAKLRVMQLVAKREAIDPLVADVEAAGHEVAFVDCWQDRPSSGLAVNFLAPSTPDAGVAQGFVTPLRALAGVALLLAVSAAFVTLARHESALEDVQGRAAKMRTQAATVRRVLERSDAAIADLARLQHMKVKQIPAIEVLEEVTRLLPDSVWLNDLRMEGDTLDISGLAKSGAALLPLFERSAIFADATMTAPLTLDPREDKERFSLRVRIRQPAGLKHAAAKENKQ